MAEAQVQAETQTGALNPHEAVAQIAQMIERSEQAEKEETQPRDEKGKFAKPEAKQVEAKPETEAEAKPAESEEEAAPPTEEKTPAQPSTWKLKINYKGEDKELEEPEVRELAQKGYDYTQKTQALAKEREELQAKVKTEQEAARKHYEDQLELHKQAVLRLADPEAINADLNKLSVEDPVKAQQLFFKRMQIQQTLQGIAMEQQRIAQQKTEEASTARQKQISEALETIQREIPGWGNELYGKILKTATDTGFTKEEANAITDPKVVKLLNKARQWDEYVAAKPKTVEKRVAAVPKVQKPGSAEKADSKTDETKTAMARLSKSGSRQDAQDLVLAMMNAGKL